MLHDVLASMRTSLGKSVLELSEDHLVSLTFIKWIGCPICKHAVEEISEYFPTFLKLNVIPVICHQETFEEGEKWLSTDFPKHPYAKYLPHVGDIDENIQHEFGLKKLSLLKHVQASPKIFSHLAHGYKLTSPKVHNPFVQFGLFLVNKGNVIKSWDFKKSGSRPDYGKYLLTFDQVSVEHVSKLSAMFPEMNSWVTQTEKQNIKVLEESWNINDILNDKELRAEFKIFVINEYSVENLLFVENVEVYQSSDIERRRELSGKIISTFLNDNSLMEVNINKELKSRVIDILSKEGPIPELFDCVVNELKLTVLSDSAIRFMQSRTIDKKI